MFELFMIQTQIAFKFLKYYKNAMFWKVFQKLDSNSLEFILN